MVQEVRTRRDELVAVALEVLERDGLHNLSIGEIARLAGIKPPSLYKQFTSKDDIEIRLIGLGFDLMAREFAEAAAERKPDMSHREEVALLGQAYRDFGHRHPQLYQLMHSRPYPEAELGPQDGQPATFYFRALLPDADLAEAAWAWAHGLLSLELSGRVAEESDPMARWNLIFDVIEATYAAGLPSD
jgi:AcrR family transcriptional regulator